MASSGGTSSGSSVRRNSCSEEENLLQLMDQRKKKRMLSNRESARRSRMKKQKHLDDLISQLAQLRKENNQIIARISITSQHYLTIESENSILRAQAAELGHRLQSLNQIINSSVSNAAGSGSSSISAFGFGTTQENTNPKTYNNNNNNNNNNAAAATAAAAIDSMGSSSLVNNFKPWNWTYFNVNQPPIMATADNMFGY